MPKASVNEHSYAMARENYIWLSPMETAMEGESDATRPQNAT